MSIGEFFVGLAAFLGILIGVAAAMTAFSFVWMFFLDLNDWGDTKLKRGIGLAGCMAMLFGPMLVAAAIATRKVIFND